MSTSFGTESATPGTDGPRRFRRSRRDHKLAGVAGGIGRALAVDPVVLRVAFAVLTVFGGFGIALYAACWLLMPAEHDEVSGLEALLGRGRSSMPPPLAIVLALVVVGSVTSSLTWGLSLVPFVAIALLVILLVGRHRIRDAAGRHFGVDFRDHAARKAFGERAGRDAQQWSEQFSRRAQHWGEHVGRRAQEWSEDFSRRVGGSRDRRRPEGSPEDSPEVSWQHDAPASPFSSAASWERPDPEPRPVREERATSTPPSWDPLGAAPFAWDLPEPGPTPPSPQELRSRRRRGIVASIGGLLAVLVAAIGGVGVWLQWWSVPLVWISASALAVVVLFMLAAALRGHRSALGGFAVLLTVVTLFLGATGITGRGGVGDTTWTPADASQVAADYRLDTGHAVLDLRSVQIPDHGTLTVEASVGAGNLEVLLPGTLRAEVSCSANLGSTVCLGQEQSGIRPDSRTTTTGALTGGTLLLDAHVGTGEVHVTQG